jgi:hypothetical protein
MCEKYRTLSTCDDSLKVLRRFLNAERLGQAEKVEGFRRLERLAPAVEETRQPMADFNPAIEPKRSISTPLDGGTLFDNTRSSRKRPAGTQLSLS